MSFYWACVCVNKNRSYLEKSLSGPRLNAGGFQSVGIVKNVAQLHEKCNAIKLKNIIFYVQIKQKNDNLQQFWMWAD